MTIASESLNTQLSYYKISEGGAWKDSKRVGAKRKIMGKK
jgi:hypothetical protein